MSAITNYLNITKPAVYAPDTVSKSDDLSYTVQYDFICARSAILGVGVALLAPVTGVFATVVFAATYQTANYLQTKHANRILDKRAVEHILTREKTEAISRLAIDHLKASSSGLQRLSNDERYSSDVLGKRDTTNQLFITALVENASSSWDRHVYRNTKAMCDRFAKERLTPNQFLEILETLNSKFAKDPSDFIFNALDSEAVKATDFTPEQVSQIWTHISKNYADAPDSRMGILLTQKGFYVNAVGDDGLTALERALVNYTGTNKILAFLFICGAKLLDVDKKIIHVDSDNVPCEVTLEQVINKHCQRNTRLASFINYAGKSQRDLIPASSFLTDVKPAFWEYRKPAIQIDSKHRKFQANVILRSIAAAAIPFLVGVTVSLVTTSVVTIALPVIFSVGTLIATYHFESKRAHTELKKIALESYKMQIPSAEVAKYILQDRNGNLLKALIEQGVNLRKFDSEGLSLWERALYLTESNRPSLRVMRILADELFKDNEFDVTREQFNEFKIALSSKRKDILTYLISSKIGPEKLFKDLHLECFLRCQDNIEMIEFLVDFGFDINAQNDNGFSILAWAIRIGMEYHFIERLLKRGANPDVRFNFRSSDQNKHENKTIEEWLAITSTDINPALNGLLAKYRKFA